jgi:5-hydroxyisourate hydrolase
MTRITTHVLDTTTGRPASGLAVRLERLDTDGPVPVAAATTGGDGRIDDWLVAGVAAGRYRIVFETGDWFRSVGKNSLYPRVAVEFEVEDGAPHYHLPLLLAPFGYSTYRGS